jgi:tetratricopeptide (TPR) repeat protein
MKRGFNPVSAPAIRADSDSAGASLLDWLCHSRTASIFGAALIGLVVIATYFPALQGGMLMDDELLTRHPVVVGPNGLYRIWLTTEPQDYWPVTNTVFWIEWRLWGKHIEGYHLVNLLLHVANCLLVWGVLRRLAVPGAFFAALLFAVHPVNVESVAWVSQLKSLLAIFFGLLSVWWWLKEENQGTTTQPCAKWFGGWQVLSFFAFVMAMLSKGSVAVLPIVLLLIAWWRHGRIAIRDFWRTAPFFAVAVALTFVNISFQTHGTQSAIRSASFAERIAGAGATIWFYLGKALFPIDLAFIYRNWDIEAGNLLWWLPALAAVIVTGSLIYWRSVRWCRAALFAWLYFCISLLPVMGLVDVGFMKYSLVADHYQYMALIGVVALVAAAISDCLAMRSGRARAAAIVFSAAAVCTLAVLTFRQAQLYGDPIALYRDNLSKNPGAAATHNNLGQILAEKGERAEAIEHYREAIKLDARDAQALNNLGTALYELGATDEAIGYFQQALAIRNYYPEAHSNLGLALQKEGRLAEATEELQAALQLRPDLTKTRFNLGLALTQQGKLPEAIDQYRAAVAIDPDYVEAFGNMAFVYGAMGRADDAIKTAETGIRIARQHGQPELAGKIEAWLAEFRRNSGR